MSSVRKHSVSLVSALVFFFPAVSSGDGSGEWTAKQQEIIDIVSVWPLGIHEDLDAWLAGYHPDWTYWEVGTDSLRTFAQQADRIRNYVQTGARVEEFEIEPIHVDVRADTAFIRYNAVETIRESTESTIEVKFSSASVFLKVDGSWKLYSTNIQYSD